MSDDIEQVFRDFEAREQRLNSLLASCPLRTVTGLIHPSGIGGTRSQNQQDWTLVMPLIAWKLEDESIQRSRLKLRQAVLRRRITKLQKTFRPYDIVRTRARIALETEAGIPLGLIEEFLPIHQPAEDLSQLALELQKPVFLNEPPFGELLLDRAADYFCAKANWNGVPIAINLSVDALGSCAQSLAIARALWNDQPTWEQLARDEIVRRLFQIKNDHWLDEGQSPLSVEQFRQTPVFETLEIGADGTFVFWLNDDDLFWDHAITVVGTLPQGITDARLEG